jgi:hypothetical protein
VKRNYYKQGAKTTFPVPFLDESGHRSPHGRKIEPMQTTKNGQLKETHHRVNNDFIPSPVNH